MNHFYEMFASLLEYPSEDCSVRVELCLQRLNRESSELAPGFAEFSRKSDLLLPAELQELYTHTFDLNPVCTLDIGYHLFGENYKRGELLAGLRETEAPYDLGQRYQLPDYLPVLLRLLVKLEDAELRSALIAECMIPALEKMIEALSQTDNPYSDLLGAINRALKIEAPEAAGRPTLAGVSEVSDLYRISPRAGSIKERPC
jgi:nitrate reductase molybdenum cofactor assembly chaperone NarJ/NarW